MFYCKFQDNLNESLSVCKEKIDNNKLYKLSSFTYLISAIFLFYNIDKLRANFKLFPWILFITLVALVSITSYLSDVVYFECFNNILLIDKILATILTILVIIIILATLLKYTRFPYIVIIIMITSVVFGIICKYYGCKNFNNYCYSEYINWHIGWHISIPLGVIISISQL